MDISDLNIREQQLIGALCIISFCQKYEIYHEDIQEFADHLLNILIADNLPDWEGEGLKLEIIGRGEPVSQSVENSIPLKLRDDFQKLVNNASEIGIVDMYGANTPAPFWAAQQCTAILAKHKIEVALSQEFLNDTSTDRWGEVWDAEKFNDLKRYLQRYKQDKLI
ncbi:hypothetical protein [Flavobacterium beibuense]|uniref:Uncharacterized protein n=1 Tax=Flavobacterium beibuense TaxID=657326 RepID=A0A444W730_9FLAO|nr:hypothetical protein [Flavobacterium beibuense]RYJ41476.1 hypothetical protein NU09_2850 [Flavobacterium beibuense]